MLPAVDTTPITTAYCQTGLMADGTQTRPRSAAHNTLPLHTRIRLKDRTAGPNGMRRYIIRDHIGWGTQLDLWTRSCATARTFGRRQVHFTIGW
jgi:3D (Asp-Asp-Asp) domain-containing protein